MTSPALPEVHLLRRQTPGGAPRGTEPADQPDQGSDLLAAPKAGASTRPSQKRGAHGPHVGQWAQEPRPADSQGSWETKPTIVDPTSVAAGG